MARYVKLKINTLNYIVISVKKWVDI
jgi:hypothetical protein